MVEYEGVQSAILSLAAIYLWDYVDDPSEVIGRRWITRYGMAEDRLKHLLNKEGPTDAETRELITTASILSIQDVSALRTSLNVFRRLPIQELTIWLDYLY